MRAEPKFDAAWSAERVRIAALRSEERAREQRIMNAAPDLLEACCKMVAQFGDQWNDPCDREAIDMARAAIAMAKGGGSQ